MILELLKAGAEVNTKWTKEPGASTPLLITVNIEWRA